MAAAVRLRPLFPADSAALAACVALQQRVFPPELWEDEAEYARVAEAGLSVVIEVGASFGGYIMAHWIYDGEISELAQGAYGRAPGMNALCIHDMVVDPTLQGKGVGAAAVARLIDNWARQHGAEAVSVMLLSVPTAIGFWCRCGFAPVREYTGETYPKGSLIMRRALSQ